jgi:hypothetical protein
MFASETVGYKSEARSTGFHYWANLSWQDKTWTEYFILDVGLFVYATQLHLQL